MIDHGIETEPDSCEAAFPATSRLPRSLSWRSPVLVALGGAVLVTTSLGPMAKELGNVSPLVWLVTAGVGGIQCLLLAELASRFSGRAGGTAQFAYRVVPRGSHTLSALSSWSYWFAWTPGIAVNLILAGAYFRDAVWPGANGLAIAAFLGVTLYVVNAFGARLSMQLAGILAAVAVVPLALVVIGPAIKPSSFDVHRIFPLVLPHDAAHGGVLATGALLLKWTFVAAWAAYGAEMASSLCAEVRNCYCDIPRAMAIAASLCLAAFTLVPVALIGVVGAAGIEQDPLNALLAASDALYGGVGKSVIGVMLVFGLLLGAQAFVLSSSRTIYQLALDGHLPQAFARVNRRGVPIGSMVWDGAIIAVMLLVFGTHVVDVVAAANVGYLIVFIMMPLAYVRLRVRPDGDANGFRLPPIFRFVALGLAAFNAVLLVVGGIQWGYAVMGIGLGVSVLIVPLSWATRAFAHSGSSRAAASLRS